MARPESLGRLWTAFLAGPVGWVVAFAAYALAPAACASHQKGQLHGLTLIGFLIVAGGTALAWRSWTAAGGPPDPRDEGLVARARLLSTLALLGNALFAALIVAHWLAVLLLHPCEPV
jgi:hypothetical protein